MKVLVVANKKGGVGKTTTALALSSGLVRRGYSVLAIDMDSQCNLSSTSKSEKGVVDIWDVLLQRENINDAIQERADSYDLICGNSKLADADKVMTEQGREYRLSESLEQLTKPYDFIVIDTPPNLGILVTQAMTAADKLLIAAQADAYSADGLMALYRSVDLVRKYSNKSLGISGILLTRYNSRTNYSNFIREKFNELAQKMGTHVFHTVIRENISIKEAQGARDSIFDYDASSNGAKDYSSFIDELLKGMN